MNMFGPCSFIDMTQKEQIIKTAEALKGVADIFRCKIWLGGTTPEKYVYPDKVNQRLNVLSKINKNIMPVAVEIHIPEQLLFMDCYGLNHVWIGARNSSNYSLLKEVAKFKGEVYIKRAPSMTVNEAIGIYDIMEKINHKTIWLIERGTVNFDRTEESRWKLNLNDVLKIKYDRPDIFKRLVIDCSHSMARKDFVGDCYKALKSIGCSNFMIECTIDGESRTDSKQIVSVNDVENIIKEYI